MSLPRCPFCHVSKIALTVCAAQCLLGKYIYLMFCVFVSLVLLSTCVMSLSPDTHWTVHTSVYSRNSSHWYPSDMTCWWLAANSETCLRMKQSVCFISSGVRGTGREREREFGDLCVCCGDCCCVCRHSKFRLVLLFFCCTAEACAASCSQL